MTQKETYEVKQSIIFLPGPLIPFEVMTCNLISLFFFVLQKVKARLIKICNKIGFLKSRCHKFVITHLDELVEELSTTDDVKTICVNVKACK